MPRILVIEIVALSNLIAGFINVSKILVIFVD